MHVLFKSALGAGLAWALFSLPVQADGDIAGGQAKSASCAACHGATGKATNALYPNIGGQNSAYLALALNAYKKGGRTGGQAGVMQAFTAGLSEQDINDLAAYYASQKP